MNKEYRRRGGRASPNPVINGLKRCPRCDTTKPVADFYPKKGPGSGVSSHCRACKARMKIEIRVRLGNKPDATIERRFWPKVNKDGPLWQGTPCWVWTGAKSNRGYGAIFYKGHDTPAHRVSMELAGHVADWKAFVVDHMCKNIACVNPAHLRICTQAENLSIYADRSKMGDKLRAAAKRQPPIPCGCGRSFMPQGYPKHRRTCPHAPR